MMSRLHLWFVTVCLMLPSLALGALANTPQCRDFEAFATQHAVDPRYVGADHHSLPPLNSDAVVVMKDGQFVFDWYDGIIDPYSPHVLWSASKDITATLMARTIQDGYSFNGRKVTLDTPLAEFFPRPPLLNQYPQMAGSYQRITIRHLIEMSANFQWKEYYDEDLEHSNFLPMLYLSGHKNMAEFALSTPLSPEGPGGRWNYSGGNANILMAVLEKIHGARYYDMPNQLLFAPLGITSGRIGRDGSGRFVGSSYVFLSPRDMARVGQLYLQNGKWNGRQLLPPDWVSDAKQITDTVYKKATDLAIIKKLGTQGRRVFWLNKPIYRDDGAIIEPGSGRRILYPAEMPEAPADMFFAAGHYGQLIIVLPSHNIVIARTGYDLKYWDHIQPLVVKALSCFSPGYRPNPVADLTPPSAGSKKFIIESLFEAFLSLPGSLRMLEYVKQSGLATAMAAKEMCSFLYASGASQRMTPAQYVPTFMARSGLPSTAKFFLQNLEFNVNPQARSVSVSRMNYRSEHGRVIAKWPVQTHTAHLDADPRAECVLEE